MRAACGQEAAGVRLDREAAAVGEEAVRVDEGQMFHANGKTFFVLSSKDVFDLTALGQVLLLREQVGTDMTEPPV